MMIGFVILVAIVAWMSVSDPLEKLNQDQRTHAQINNGSQMMKLILFDSMIAYNCDTGGDRQSLSGSTGPTFWGSWENMRHIWKTPGMGQISFDEINQSMPMFYEGLPCYAPENALTGSGGIAQEAGIGKEWKDDQHGKRSRIKFEANDTFTLPACFVHWTQDDFPAPGGWGGAVRQMQAISGNEVTNSWFLITDETGPKSAWHRGGGFATFYSNEIDAGTGCEKIARSGKEDKGAGPIMDVEVIDDHTSKLNLQNSFNVNDIAKHIGGDVFDPDPNKLREYEFPEGTKGYVQTNIGCSPGSTPYAVDNTPGQDTGEITDKGKCANTLHPFIVITKVGN